MEDDIYGATASYNDKRNEASRKIDADIEKKKGIRYYLKSAAIYSLLLAVSIAGSVFASRMSNGRPNNFFHTIFNILLCFFAYTAFKYIRHLFEWIKYHKENPGTSFATFRNDTLWKDTHGGR